MPNSTYLVTLGERVLRVQIRSDGDGTRVRVDDGPEQPARLRTVHGPLRSLQVGAHRAELLAATDADGVLVALEGVEIHASVVDEAHARLASLAGARADGKARNELRAPMPGLVVNVLCKPGDQTEPGQPLVVLQAMKMENELSLVRGGKVSVVNATPGQTVEQNQVLIVVE